MLKIYDLKCDERIKPINIDCKNPIFSFKIVYNKYISSDSDFSYRIIVSSDLKSIHENKGDMYDSQYKFDSQPIFISYKGKDLLSHSKYYWVAEVIIDGISYRSKIEWFETAYLNNKIISAKWVSGSNECDSPLIRCNFNTAEKISKAKLHCTGLGWFEPYINGNKVGTEVLSPAQTDFDERKLDSLKYPLSLDTRKTVFYLTYDVTDYLSEGKNTIGIWLGNGWYNQKERIAEGSMQYGSPKTLFEIIIAYENGSTQIISSNHQNCKTHKSPIVFNNIYLGEKYDASLEEAHWSSPSYDDSSWEKAYSNKAPTAKLIAQQCPSDIVLSEYSPVKVETSDKAIYDVGTNITGWINLKVKGSAGSSVKITFAEELDELSNLDYASCGGINQIQNQTYILKGDCIEMYKPRFMWAGFRYFEINTNAEILDIKAEMVATDIPISGSFFCSNPLWNKLYHMYLQSQLTNIHGCVPSDCPHRERLGYTGDGHIITESCLLSLDSRLFIKKWIDDIKNSQNKMTGHVPHTAPFMGGGGGPGWGSAIIIVPWEYYIQTGDLSVLEECFHSMQMWIKYLSSRCYDGYIVVKEEPDGWCLGDWCAPGEMIMPEAYVNTVIYAKLSGIMIKIASILKRDAHFYIQLKANIKDAVNKKWYNKTTGKYSIGGQGANALALWAEIVTEEEIKKTADEMARHITEDCEGHLDTGIIATPILLEMLTKHGYENIACKILNKTTYPSFGFMLECGATTLWERFEGIDSHNHPMFGSYTAWFYKNVLGINTDENNAGYKNIIIYPKVYNYLDYAEGQILTNYGYIKINWTHKNKDIIIYIDTPALCTIEFIAQKNYLINYIKDRNNIIIEPNNSKTVKLTGGKYTIKLVI